MVYKTIPELYKEKFYVADFIKTTSTKLQVKVRVDFLHVILQDTLNARSITKAIATRTHGRSNREVITYVLNFLQSIPYDHLKSRNAMEGLGFVPPLTLIAINKGDCDTKSTALATLLRTLLPNVNMAMVFIPNHAFVALDIPMHKGDDTININGRNYVVVDPTGPSLSAVGKAHKRAKPYLKQKRNKLEYLINIPNGLKDSFTPTMIDLR